MCSYTVSVAIALATSPAAAPPMPSATTNNEPRGPISWFRTAGNRDAWRRVRSATRKRSSLWSRVRPRSVFAKTSTLIGLDERPNMLGTAFALELAIDFVPRRQPQRQAAPAAGVVFAALDEIGVGHHERRLGPEPRRNPVVIVDNLGATPPFRRRGGADDEVDNAAEGAVDGAAVHCRRPAAGDARRLGHGCGHRPAGRRRVRPSPRYPLGHRVEARGRIGFFFLMKRRQRRSPLFPYTTLFR